MVAAPASRGRHHSVINDIRSSELRPLNHPRRQPRRGLRAQRIQQQRDLVLHPRRALVVFEQVHVEQELGVGADQLFGVVGPGVGVAVGGVGQPQLRVQAHHEGGVRRRPQPDGLVDIGECRGAAAAGDGARQHLEVSGLVTVERQDRLVLREEHRIDPHQCRNRSEIGDAVVDLARRRREDEIARAVEPEALPRVESDGVADRACDLACQVVPRQIRCDPGLEVEQRSHRAPLSVRRLRAAHPQDGAARRAREPPR